MWIAPALLCFQIRETENQTFHTSTRTGHYFTQLKYRYKIFKDTQGFKSVSKCEYSSSSKDPRTDKKRKEKKRKPLQRTVLPAGRWSTDSILRVPLLPQNFTPQVLTWQGPSSQHQSSFLDLALSLFVNRGTAILSILRQSSYPTHS